MPPTDRSTCQINDWVVFGEGFHKDTIYSRETNQRMAANFARLSMGPNATVRPSVKIGHDFAERSAKSLGFPTLGRISRCETEPNGLVHLWLSGVPAQLGAAVNADLFTAGSIEIAPPLPDPNDQSQKLYPVLTGVALLGEEQPAVKLPHPIPRAVFADGTQVPPEKDLTKWLTVMAEVSRATFGGNLPRLKFAGREFVTSVVSFAALSPISGAPMDPKIEQLVAALTECGIAPDKAQAVAQALAGDAMSTPAPDGDAAQDARDQKLLADVAAHDRKKTTGVRVPGQPAAAFSAGAVMGQLGQRMCRKNGFLDREFCMRKLRGH